MTTNRNGEGEGEGGLQRHLPAMCPHLESCPLSRSSSTISWKTNLLDHGGTKGNLTIHHVNDDNQHRDWHHSDSFCNLSNSAEPSQCNIVRQSCEQCECSKQSIRLAYGLQKHTQLPPDESSFGPG